MINKLVRIANSLDKKGFLKEAEWLDKIISIAADGFNPDFDEAGKSRMEVIKKVSDAFNAQAASLPQPLYRARAGIDYNLGILSKDEPLLLVGTTKLYTQQVPAQAARAAQIKSLVEQQIGLVRAAGFKGIEYIGVSKAYSEKDFFLPEELRTGIADTSSPSGDVTPYVFTFRIV